MTKRCILAGSTRLCTANLGRCNTSTRNINSSTSNTSTDIRIGAKF
jgi:hypothetical protein